ncbi:MAG: undecaprenyl-diphosphate phosphatase [Nitrospirota bacterium]|nr:undecaprenyl-diphosphate phosphatase [Nitrospirota bacterium]MDP2382904.1 undecaprenyl-diphosphate phosphatase [Nitrospirota bacterium]
MNEWGPGLATILGIVEGLTEFLPVSSTGHLILVGHVLGFEGDLASSAEISIQLGAILAVIAYERHKLASMVGQAGREQQDAAAMIRTRGTTPWTTVLKKSWEVHRNLWFLLGLGLAFLPAAAIGFLTHSWIKSHLFTPQTVAASSIVGGLIILAVEARRSHIRVQQLEQVDLPSAFWIGVAQCASLLPGMSRSGSTIIGGLLVGLDRKVATEYSFFLALPTLIAATCYQMWKSRDIFRQEDYLALGVGMFVSFIVAWVVIAAFLTFVKRHTLRPFAYYRILMGIAVFYIFGF